MTSVQDGAGEHGVLVSKNKAYRCDRRARPARASAAPRVKEPTRAPHEVAPSTHDLSRPKRGFSTRDLSQPRASRADLGDDPAQDPNSAKILLKSASKAQRAG